MSRALRTVPRQSRSRTAAVSRLKRSQQGPLSHSCYSAAQPRRLWPLSRIIRRWPLSRHQRRLRTEPDLLHPRGPARPEDWLSVVVLLALGSELSRHSITFMASQVKRLRRPPARPGPWTATARFIATGDLWFGRLPEGLNA
jgi:hypothetical protein